MGRVSTWVAPRGRTPPTLGVLGSGGRRAVQAGSLRPLGGRGNEIDTDSKAQRRPSGEFATAVKDNPTAGALRLTNIVPAQGALPIIFRRRNRYSLLDHGIEPPDERARAGKPPQASVTLGAVQRGGEVQVQVSDDGRGLNEAAILEKAVARGLTNVADAARLKPHEIHRFIFAPGFSTAAKVTETSGRGVGMDVVLNTVQQLGGDIDVETKAGGGATFTLRLPLSAAMQASLLVRVNGQTFGIAERFVSSVLEVAAEDMLESSGQKAIRHNGMALPVYRLADLLWQDAADGGATPDFLSIVVISNGRETIGLEVDRVRRRQELFLKDLHPLLAACPTVSGAAVLGDGRIVLLLDADELIQLVRSGTWRGAPEAATEAAP